MTKNDEGTKASLLDVDVIVQNSRLEEDLSNKLLDTIDSAHSKEKSIFFGLLEKDFLDTLDPEY